MEVVDMDEQIYTFEDVINSEKHVEMIEIQVHVLVVKYLFYSFISPPCTFYFT